MIIGMGLLPACNMKQIRLMKKWADMQAGVTFETDDGTAASLVNKGVAVLVRNLSAPPKDKMIHSAETKGGT